MARIRVGIGGWSYAPWHETFFPVDIPKTKTLDYASRQFGAIEINSTFYGTQKPSTFAKWHDQTPDDFIFTIKAPRVSTHRRHLNDAAKSIERFFMSGLERLGSKLGPLLWQFPSTKAFVADEFDAFLSSLPTKLGAEKLRHALDVRHDSFAVPEFIALARRHKAAIVITDASDAPKIYDPTADFVYARLREARSSFKAGYRPVQLKRWAAAVQGWQSGEISDHGLLLLEDAKKQPRDAYLFFINGAKERAPAAALQLQKLLTKAKTARSRATACSSPIS